MSRAHILIGALGAALAFLPAQANAGEIFGGLYVHDVDTPFTLSGVEGGADVMLGYRGGKIFGTRLQPYVLGSLHTKGQTHFAAVGLSAKFGDKLYIRPGLGIAVHSGSAANFEDPDNGKIDFGSRVLFQPEVGIGTRLAPRTTIEASWVHLSQGQIFGRQNPGMDSFGVRLNVELP